MLELGPVLRDKYTCILSTSSAVPLVDPGTTDKLNICVEVEERKGPEAKVREVAIL